jgi:inosose dehydratase
VQRQHQCVRVGQVTTGTARGKPNAPKNIIPLMIRVANAPCSWGVLEFDSSTRSAPFAQVLDEIRATGYAGTELGDWGFLPTDPQRLRAELAARELSLVGAFVPVALANRDTHAAGVDTAVRTARLMRDADAPDSFIVLSDNNGAVPVREQHAGRIPASLSLTPAEWRTFADGVNRIARAVADETGVRTVFHPHCGGYVETPQEIDALMSHTDAGLVGLVLDTGHIIYGGGDPVRVLRHHGHRVWHVHFKDCDPVVASRARADGLGYLAAVRAQLFCELGAGEVDFAATKGGWWSNKTSFPATARRPKARPGAGTFYDRSACS